MTIAVGFLVCVYRSVVMRAAHIVPIFGAEMIPASAGKKGRLLKILQNGQNLKNEKRGRRRRMSGGSLNYFYGILEDHVGDFGDVELDDLVRDLAKLFHDREWYLSSDTCEGAWRESRDNFKKKWFGKNTRKERIERYLEEFKQNAMDQLGVSEEYCRNCAHWSEEKEKDSEYGECDISPRVLMHRSERCEKFEKKGVVQDEKVS